MEWRKLRAKRAIEWAREDIQFYTESVEQYRKLLKKHMVNKHSGQYDINCERCKLWKEVIEGAKSIIIQSKQSIKEVLRGER